jgi:hypothetical protein
MVRAYRKLVESLPFCRLKAGLRTSRAGEPAQSKSCRPFAQPTDLRDKELTFDSSRADLARFRLNFREQLRSILRVGSRQELINNLWLH